MITRRASRAMRAALVLVTTALCLHACSLFVPFDDYAASGSPDAATSAVDAGDAADSDDAAECADVDTENDPKHCGTCRRACVSGSCTLGRCPIEEMFSDPLLGSIEHLAVADAGDGTWLYFTATDAGLGRSRIGSNSYELAPVAPSTRAPGPVSVDSDQHRGALVYDDSILVFDLDTFASPLKTVTSNRSDAGAIILKGIRVYWAETTGLHFSKAQAGAPVSTPSGDAGRPVAFDLTPAGDVAFLGDDAIVWELRSGGTLPLAQTGAIEKALGSVDFDELNAKTFFALRSNPSAVVRIELSNLSAPVVQELGGSALSSPRRVVATGAQLYVLNNDGVRLLRLDGTGRNLFALTDKLSPSHALVVDGPWVYVASGSKVVRTSK